MEKYAVGENVPMKFHKALVYVLIPLSLLISVITFIVLLGTVFYAPVLSILLLIILAGSFALSLAAEILLLQMRRTGIILLYVGYGLSVVSSLITLLTDFTLNNIISLVLMAGIIILIYIYYEKRTALFH
ncbi:MAG TPA: hypothetical protein PKD52_07860 [Clostridiales bacterium]|nr:hypothetical protein [Clostridiales bacterium]